MSTKHEIPRPLELLIPETREHLKSLNYSESTISKMNSAWKHLLHFAAEEDVTHFTTEFGYRFLKEKFDIEPFVSAKSRHQKNLRRSVVILSDFQRNGFIHSKQASKSHQWIPEFQHICDEFMEDPARKNLSDGYQRQYRLHLRKLTEFLLQRQILSISEVTEKSLDIFVASYTGYAKSTIFNAFAILRTFLHFAYEQGYISKDFSPHVPKVKVNQRANLPSVFTSEELKRLISAVDRGSPQGKRDYAILLLAIRYGMRVGEITALKLQDLDFQGKKINYTQNKTSVKMSVDMLENVGWALLDYLKNARPVTDSNHVFVRHNAPFTAFPASNNLSHIMDKYLTRAGIKRTSDRHYGMHTIRHSLASHLLEQGNPLHVVSDVLGHLEMNNTMIYTKIDLKTLSLCALEVPYGEK